MSTIKKENSGFKKLEGAAPGDPSGSAAVSPPREMGCSEVQQHLLQALHPEEAGSPALRQHLASCPPCQIFRSQLLLLDDLARQQAPELPEGFELSLRRRLNESARGDSTMKPASDEAAAAALAKRGTGIRVAAAAAVLVLVFGVGALVASRWFKAGEEKLTYHQLHLSIRAQKEYNEVFFNVTLPEGIRPLPNTVEALGQRNLLWQSALRRGFNELDLPLVSSRTEGRVIVRVSAGKEYWTGSVAINPTDKQTSDSRRDGQELRLALVLGPDNSEREESGR
jgi:hypothetical protein